MQPNIRRRDALCSGRNGVSCSVFPGVLSDSSLHGSQNDVTRRQTVRNSILASTAAVLALLVAHGAGPAAQGRQRISGEGFVSEGIPKMPNPPGPAPKQDLSGAWVGPGTSNKPDPVPPMTPAGERIFKERKGYGAASGNFGARGQAAGCRRYPGGGGGGRAPGPAPPPPPLPPPRPPPPPRRPPRHTPPPGGV